MMDKEAQIYKILAEIQKYQNESECPTSVLFILVDPERELAENYGKGDIMLLSQGFTHIMNDSENFNRLMKALMGMYLSRNPEEKKAFLAGLELIKDLPNNLL